MTGEVLVRAEPAALDPQASVTHPLREVRDRAGPERDVDERIELEDPLALRLRVAATHRDHELRVLALAGTGVAEICRQPRVGLLPDRARVENDDVRLVR